MILVVELETIWEEIHQVEKTSILISARAHYLPLPNKADQELLDFLGGRSHYSRL
jgi:hypothetical protein